MRIIVRKYFRSRPATIISHRCINMRARLRIFGELCAARKTRTARLYGLFIRRFRKGTYANAARWRADDSRNDATSGVTRSSAPPGSAVPRARCESALAGRLVTICLRTRGFKTVGKYLHARPSAVAGRARNADWRAGEIALSGGAIIRLIRPFMAPGEAAAESRICTVRRLLVSGDV